MEINQLTEQNPWWIDKEKINNDEKVQEALSKKHKFLPKFQKGNFLIIGPRQVGKTTYLKLIIRELLAKGIDSKRFFYLSCEPFKNFEEIIEIVRFSDTLIKGEKYFFFDEITFIKDWQRAIKYILDSELKNKKTFYISGSSTIALKKETFPGRDIKIKEFLPLSFREFCQIFVSENLKNTLNKIKLNSLEVSEVYKKAKQVFFFSKEISSLFADYMQTGGFPRSIYELIEGNGIKEETYEIYWKWLVSDIAKIDRSERITRSVLISVLKNYSSKFSLNSIAKEMEIGSHVTIREYLEILENLFVLRNVFPFDFAKKTECFRKMRKIYFTDPFLFSVYKKTLTKQQITDDEIPKIIEGIVSEHLIRKFGKVFYASNGKEIDFILNKTAIEVKWRAKTSFKDFGKITLKNNILLSKSNFDFKEKDKILIIPASLFLTLI